jgi:hypothetical protein
VQKYLGTAAALGYLVAVVVGLPVVMRLVLRVDRRFGGDRRLVWLALLSLVLLVVLFLVVYPRANAHVGGTSGSDRDEAANLGAQNLLHGHYPYRGKTYLGNPISDLPGALLLALPFVLVLGNSAYQNLFWLPLAFLRMRIAVASTAVALLLSWIVLALSPGAMREFLTGGDLLANSLWVPLLMLAVLDAARTGRARLELLAAAALGIGLSSRANFLLVVPILFGVLAQHYGLRRAVRDVLIAGAAFLLVTLPFYVYDPGGFTPLKVQNHLKQFDTLVPDVHVAVAVAALVLSIAFAFRPMDALGGRAMAACAAVQAFVIVAAVVLASIHAHAVDFTFLISSYGLTALGFAVLATATALRATEPLRPRPPA